MLAPQGFGLNMKKYRFNNIGGGSDIINANFNPIVINDTTAASTTATSYTQVKSYSSIGGVKNWYGKYMVNAIRIQVYGYVSAGTGYAQITVDGSTSYTVIKAITGTATGTSFTNTSSSLIIDAIIELTANASHTIAINAYNSTSGDTTYISDVYGFQGYAVTSTSLNLIDSETLNNFIFDEIGFQYYQGGIYVAAFVNRSTTATVTLQYSDNFTASGQSYTSTLGAFNDPANQGWWISPQIPVYNSVPAGYNGSWSWSVYGQVGASGDVLLIGNLYVWFNFTTLIPTTDLLVSIAIQIKIFPSQSEDVDLEWNNFTFGGFYGNLASTPIIFKIISTASNSNGYTSPETEIVYNTIPLTLFTKDMVLYTTALVIFIEIEAIEI